VAYYTSTKVKARRSLTVEDLHITEQVCILRRTGAGEVVNFIGAGAVVLTRTWSTSVQIYLTLVSLERKWTRISYQM